MEKWQENRNYRKIRDENGTVVANIITVDGRDVAVTEDVFAAYAQMDRRERYLNEDRPLARSSPWNRWQRTAFWPDYVGAETAPSAEDCVLARESEREREELASLLLAALIALEDRDRQLITALFYDPSIHQGVRPALGCDPAGRHQAQGPDPEGPEKIF